MGRRTWGVWYSIVNNESKYKDTVHFGDQTDHAMYAVETEAFPVQYTRSMLPNYLTEIGKWVGSLAQLYIGDETPALDK